MIKTVGEIQRQVADLMMRQTDMARQLRRIESQPIPTSPRANTHNTAQRVIFKGETYYVGADGSAFLNDATMAGWTKMGNDPAVKLKVVSKTLDSTPSADTLAHGIASGKTKIQGFMAWVEE